MDFNDVLYETSGPVAVIRLNRPQYRNAQSYRLLDDLDAALGAAMADRDIKVAIVAGSGGNFSSGHDLGTPEQVAIRSERSIPTYGIGYYDNFRHYNLDLTLKWHNLPKPTIAMVHGYCIYGGWMIANAMDLIFASEDALFLAGLVEYFSVPWDIGPRAAKELLFESRFITAREAKDMGMVSRVYAAADLETETLAYANRVAENSSMTLRLAKLSVNKMLDAQGYTNTMESGFHDYWVVANPGRQAVPPAAPEAQPQRTERRLPGVDLALRRLREQQEGGGR